MPCYLPVMQYAHNQELRKTLYTAYATIASEQSDEPKWDNSSAIEKLLELRIQEAELLRYEEFAQLQLQNRMSDTAEQINEILQYLPERSKPFTKRKVECLSTFNK